MGSERAAHLEEVVAVARRRGATEDVQDLVDGYLADVADDDITHRDPADLCGMVLTHVGLARSRRPGQTLIRVFTPRPAEDGWTTGHTVVHVVTDDIPFLVDSTVNELNRVDRSIHLVVHPRLMVSRDSDGRLGTAAALVRDGDGDGDGSGRGNAAAASAVGHAVESWLHIEIDRSSVDDPTADQMLAESLARVLGDVAAAVGDWEAMRATARSLAAELDEAPAPNDDPDECTEAARLLRWLTDGHFTFVGYREYVLDDSRNEGAGGPTSATARLVSKPETGLGVLRTRSGAPPTVSTLGARASRIARRRDLLILTKTNSRSTVHRPGYLDYIGLRTFDRQGRVTGERRFIGLLASSVYTQSVLDVPVIGRKAAAVIDTAGYDSGSHSSRELLAILENYPRDELFAADVDTLTHIATAVLQMQERRRTRLFVRRDDFGRYVSCLVYLPRDRYTTAVRLAIEDVLADAFAADGIEHSSLVGESVLARLHFIVRTPPGRGPGGADLARIDQAGVDSAGVDSAGVDSAGVDVDEVERRIVACTRTWDEDLDDVMRAELGEAEAVRMTRRWVPSLPESYKEDVSARVAAADLIRLETLEAGHGAAPDLDLLLYNPTGAAAGHGRLKLFRRDEMSLSSILPFFDHLGVEVLDQRPYHLLDVPERDHDGDQLRSWWVYDFGLRLPAVAVDPGTTTDQARLAGRFSEAFVAAWTGTSESDQFDRLVLRAGLTWRQVVVLRTYARYLRQTGTPFSEGYIASALGDNPEVARLLVAVFETRFHPDRFAAGPGNAPCDSRVHAQTAAAAAARIVLEDVASLAQDQILRSILATIEASLRTNFFQPGQDGEPNPTVAIKLDPRRVPGLPNPRPAFEIWVCGPRVEGVHLRFGAVARGGLRWSDRHEDFRTEVLGLVKAQQVKNAVIVPMGAKGGFVAKQLPDPARDRDAWYAEGTRCYQLFVSALLDVTDNRDLAAGGKVVPPARVVRQDNVDGSATTINDDPYLVVAADKGTAAFSDVANAISVARGFWLGDAFASGGSRGYDHKVMGITARGAWESVRRHFREVGVDVDTEHFTVAGIGDMSGDVFGNGMLLSRGIRLVAAFDHRHVFIDPDPDPEVSFAERARLFALPRSSWADYDRSLLSAGGAVHPRSAKVIELWPDAAHALGLPDPGSGPSGWPIRLTPNELVRAVLLAPVDLLWNGGIGTYVKAVGETPADVGDKANDGVRIDGGQLRARVVGEGGNLGLTQRGRVEAALHGVRLNTDAIDNSAGVDTSDHEVNIKIVLDRVVADGDLTARQRDDLLVTMTDDVAASVLRHNIDQNTHLGNGRHQAVSMLPVYTRFLRWLTEHGGLDRDLEFLPTEEVLEARAAEGRSLVGPELAVISAYAKLSLKAALLATAVPDESWSQRFLHGYFPPDLRSRFGDRLDSHPLRREIIATTLANRVLNSTGSTFVFRLGEELSATADGAVRAWAVAAEVFRQAEWHNQVSELDAAVPVTAANDLRLAHRRVMDRAARWFLQSRPDPLDVDAEVARFVPVVVGLRERLQSRLREAGRKRPSDVSDALVARGVPADMARRAEELLDEFTLLDITEIAQRTGEDPGGVLDLHVTLQERYSVDPVLIRISDLPRKDRWQALARAALRYDLYGAIEELTSVIAVTVPAESVPQGSALARVERWESANAAATGRARAILLEVESLPTAELAPLQVALRTLRGVVRSGSAEGAGSGRV